MNRRLLLAVTAVLSLAFAQACSGPRTPRAGNVTFAWSFYGYSCAQDPDIQAVRVTIPGEALANNGIYPCSSNGYDGVVVYDFAPGTYRYTVDAIDYSGNLIYSSGGTFVVDGNILVRVDLTPVRSQAPTYGYLAWDFPPDAGAARPCEDGRVARVAMRIDDGAPAYASCADGLGDPGARSTDLQPGAHRVLLEALGGDGAVLYSARSSFTTYVGSPVSARFSLAAPARP